MNKIYAMSIVRRVAKDKKANERRIADHLQLRRDMERVYEDTAEVDEFIKGYEALRYDLARQWDACIELMHQYDFTLIEACGTEEPDILNLMQVDLRVDPDE